MPEQNQDYKEKEKNSYSYVKKSKDGKWIILTTKSIYPVKYFEKVIESEITAE